MPVVRCSMAPISITHTIKQSTHIPNKVLRGELAVLVLDQAAWGGARCAARPLARSRALNLETG